MESPIATSYNACYNLRRSWTMVEDLQNGLWIWGLGVQVPSLTLTTRAGNL